MEPSHWLAFAGLIVAILLPAAMGIRRLGRIEGSIDTHGKQIEALFKGVATATSSVSDHTSDCDKDRAVLHERVQNNTSQIESLKTA